MEFSNRKMAASQAGSTHATKHEIMHAVRTHGTESTRHSFKDSMHAMLRGSRKAVATIPMLAMFLTNSYSRINNKVYNYKLVRPVYNYQLAETFTNDNKDIKAVVNAVKNPKSSNIIFSTYLLNGLTNTGFWIQVGLIENVQTKNNKERFEIALQEWNSAANTVFPKYKVNLAGHYLFNREIKPGDNIKFGMKYSVTGIYVYALDLRTDDKIAATFPASGSSEFVGLKRYNVNRNGYFTGIMREEILNNPFVPRLCKVAIMSENDKNKWIWSNEVPSSPLGYTLYPSMRNYYSVVKHVSDNRYGEKYTFLAKDEVIQLYHMKNRNSGELFITGGRKSKVKDKVYKTLDTALSKVL